jgi:hypothetical protein
VLRARVPGLSLRRLGRVAASILALLAASPPGADGQTTLEAGVDAAFRTNFYWRGLLRDDRAALYPEAWLSVGRGPARLTGGVWTQLRFADPAPAPSDATALGDAWLGASDLWLEAGLALGRGELTLGVDRLLYADGATGQTGSAVNTTELSAAAWWDTGLLIPRLRLALDVGALEGGYAETGLELRVPTLPSRNPVLGLTLAVTAGWSAALTPKADTLAPRGPAYFADDGLTHVETQLRLAVGRGPTQAWLEVGGQLFRGDGAWPAGTGGSRAPGSGWWVGIGAADAAVLGRF